MPVGLEDLRTSEALSLITKYPECFGDTILSYALGQRSTTSFRRASLPEQALQNVSDLVDIIGSQPLRILPLTSRLERFRNLVSGNRTGRTSRDKIPLRPTRRDLQFERLALRLDRQVTGGGA